MNRNAGNVGVVDMASGPGFVAAGFVVAGLVAGGVAVVTGPVGVAVVYSTGMCTGRGTVGGEGEGGRGGVFSVFCACGVVCVVLSSLGHFRIHGKTKANTTSRRAIIGQVWNNNSPGCKTCHRKWAPCLRLKMYQGKILILQYPQLPWSP